MSGLAILLWGFGLGWIVATWRARRPTPEHTIGEKLVKEGRDALWRARIVGPGFKAVHKSTLRVDGKEVACELSVEGKEPAL